MTSGSTLPPESDETEFCLLGRAVFEEKTRGDEDLTLVSFDVEVPSTSSPFASSQPDFANPFFEPFNESPSTPIESPSGVLNSSVRRGLIRMRRGFWRFYRFLRSPSRLCSFFGERRRALTLSVRLLVAERVEEGQSIIDQRVWPALQGNYVRVQRMVAERVPPAVHNCLLEGGLFLSQRVRPALQSSVSNLQRIFAAPYWIAVGEHFHQGFVIFRGRVLPPLESFLSQWQAILDGPPETSPWQLDVLQVPRVLLQRQLALLQWLTSRGLPLLADFFSRLFSHVQRLLRERVWPLLKHGISECRQVLMEKVVPALGWVIREAHRVLKFCGQIFPLSVSLGFRFWTLINCRLVPLVCCAFRCLVGAAEALSIAGSSCFESITRRTGRASSAPPTPEGGAVFEEVGVVEGQEGTGALGGQGEKEGEDAREGGTEEAGEERGYEGSPMKH
uniref:Uncharacterized protein n=1 Tax=Chromera velia CCMP2878 TaxID=1169474 RepID=A0A0G4H1J4_9ALVE|eukprot:Cvel_24313.t1-p1 / transcript=Cvel_24313.t1 / gene=Cvel_24313 / organism=Chromera_velia_CCMP2878 / gene_product=hypothetical protein / transcript_product=hypothetical protein / location=Cvel_scaffold2612:24090-26030(+) / protein_length=446 / sequence_SO=supercontig / SO=protein_coding / is_pseudo=false